MKIRPALDTLREIRHGGLLDDLTDSLHEVVTACDYTNKKGSITLTLSIAPDDKTGTAIIIDKIKTVIPNSNATLFHITNDRNLSLRNPRQPDIPELEAVSTRKDIEKTNQFSKNMESK